LASLEIRFTAETQGSQREVFFLMQSGLRRDEVATATQAGDGDWIRNRIPSGKD